jgi:hypothetical protein
VGGRYSYTAALLTLVNSGVVADYWDYQGRVSYALTPRDRVSVFAFGSYDYLGQKNGDGSVTTLFSTTFHRVDLRYDHVFDNGDTLRHAITLGIDHTGLDLGGTSQGDGYVQDDLVATRTELVHRLGDGALLRAGADAGLDSYVANLGGDAGDKSFTSLFNTRVDVSMGLRADVVVQVTPRLEVTPGLRLDYYGSQGATALGFDPRLAARLALSRRFRLVEVYGVASQPPSFILPGPGFTRPLADGGLQRAIQTSAGVEVDLPEDTTATVTLFRDAFFNLTDPLGSAPSDGGGVPDVFNQRSLGWSQGLEVNVHRRLTRTIGGILSYTLSSSTRALGNATFPSEYDRTHVANLALTYDFGGGYRAGARALFYTGTPKEYVGDPPAQLAQEMSHPGRLPPFFRLDVRAEKRWPMGKKRWVSVVLEVFNATLTKETIAEVCTHGLCAATVIGPVTIPSLGLEGGF